MPVTLPRVSERPVMLVTPAAAHLALAAPDRSAMRERLSAGGPARQTAPRRRIYLALTVLAVLASVLFALRTYWSYELLRSAYGSACRR